jgi:prevent-host-death family protein
MSLTIGLAEAKARLSELVDRAEAGETIIISRNGTEVAELRPLHRLTPAEAAAKIRELGERVRKRNAGKPPWPPPGKSWRDIAHERHKH